MFNWPKRNIPPVNYNEDSEDTESSFNSPPPGTPNDESQDGLGQLRGVIDQTTARDNLQQVADQLANQVALNQPAVNMPPAPLPYDRSTGEDGDDVYKKLGTLTNKFSTSDPKFWFSNFERSPDN